MSRLATFLLSAALIASSSAASFDIIGPPGSGAFGEKITLLPNGNIVVVDSLFDSSSPVTANVGAVYLYTPDGALISVLKGSTSDDRIGNAGVTVLANGNFLVRSSLWDNGSAANAGAVTWGDAERGFIGGASAVVSSSNSLVGSSVNDAVSGPVTALKNGHYVVLSSNWTNPSPVAAFAGAATWGNGFTGTTGVISAANSLVGTSAFDAVGSGLVELTNGNYVIRSFSWDSQSPVAVNVGAVTLAPGDRPITGPVSVANSLVGSTAGDQVGTVFDLRNGNFLVASPSWDATSPATADVGAVTFCNGTTGLVGPVSASNSLVGGTAGDRVSDGGVVVLNNGNYVIGARFWDNPSPLIVNVGAVTWGNGRTGIAGPVSALNSLVGTSESDQVGSTVALTNGNYVVVSNDWDSVSPPVVNAGAATWCNGTTGRTGPISSTNSLVGTTPGDSVGNGSVIALTNGNYVVSSFQWALPFPLVAGVGAATWGNGTTGVKGAISAANSLIGSSINDSVGELGVALTNGNYVITSQFWDNGSISDAGAVTWGNGSTGIKGVVSVANSLVGTSPSDKIGSNNTTALTNGSYVVRSPLWNRVSPPAASVGAATWGNGTTGIKGVVSAANSLVGTTANDQVSLGGALALRNGNYLVLSRQWNNAAAGVSAASAITWGQGSTGITGPVTMANSLVGDTTNDVIGTGLVLPTDDGNAIAFSDTADNTSPATFNAGAVTLFNGATGTVGLLSKSPTIFGTVASSGGRLTRAYDAQRQRLIVGNPAINRVNVISNRLESLAKTGAEAPGAAEIAFSTAGSAAVATEGGALVDYTLTGAGSTGKNRAMFSTLSVGQTVDLDLRLGDSLSALSSLLPVDVKCSALSKQIAQQSGRGLFQSIITGTGITTANNQLLLGDDGVHLSMIYRLGAPIAGLSSATTAKLLEVLQSHDQDLITLSYQLKTSTVPLVTTNNDTGIALLKQDGTFVSNFAAREGESGTPFGATGTFGQFTGRGTAGRGTVIYFTAAFKPTSGSAANALLRTDVAGTSRSVVAVVGAPAPGTGQIFASLPAFTNISTQALYKGTITGPTTQNEGLWQDGVNKLRKGDAIDAVNLPGVKLGSISRFWPAGTQFIVQCTLTGTGVTTANNQALILRQDDNTNLILLRTGSAAPGCGPAKVATISAVDVSPISGRYVALGTLSGSLSTNNQALWTGNAALGNSTTLKELRTPALRLRKGQAYRTASTLDSVVRSITIKPAVDATGAGGRGLAQCIGANGDVAVYILGDRSLTELVMLPP
jgi:hypothetical protein